MYRCEHCNTITGPKTPQARRITVSRPIEYPSRWQIIRKGKVAEVKTFPYGEMASPPRPNKYEKWVCIDKGGRGTETVKESILCPECAKMFDEGGINVR